MPQVDISTIYIQLSWLSFLFFFMYILLMYFYFFHIAVAEKIRYYLFVTSRKTNSVKKHLDFQSLFAYNYFFFKYYQIKFIYQLNILEKFTHVIKQVVVVNSYKY